MKNLSFSILFFLFTFNGFAQNLDVNLLKEINVNRNTNLDAGFNFITNTAKPLSIATPVIFYSIGLIKKDSSLKSNGIYIGEALVANLLITTAFKYSFNRERPYERYSFIQNATTESSPSFPSGHTSTSFALATSLSIAYPKWYVIAPSFLYASTVAYSRMHLGVHYPSDVFVGALIGVGSTLLTHEINKWLKAKKRP